MAPDSAVLDAAGYDVLVVGAGFAGIMALHQLTQAGLRVRLLEAGAGLGGTWYWNRYPGARVDIESLEYSYGFSDEIQQQWCWPERFASQADVLRYLEWVADTLDLRRHMSFDTRIATATFDHVESLWTLSAASGEQFRARYCVMAVGFLSAAYMPDIPGIADFQGTLLHTGSWPEAGVDLHGKRVGIVGVGATGVQLVPKVAEQAQHLSVFQRTPNWCMPVVNEPMPKAYEAFAKACYGVIRNREYSQRGAGIVLFNYEIVSPREDSALAVSAAERDADYEQRWRHGAAHITNSFNDLLTNEAANDTLRKFWTRKIFEAVDDADLANTLIPDHPPLSRRPCGETGYYAAFNRDNVALVPTAADAIVRITPHGLQQASGAEHALDVLIFATGFDAGSGPLLRLAIHGRDGESLRDKWGAGAVTHLGMMTHGFPNLFFMDGPQSPAAFFSPPLLVAYQAATIARLIERAADIKARTIEPSLTAEVAWCAHVSDVINATLLPRANSWWMGANIPGKPRQVVAYAGGFGAYRDWTETALDNSFQDYLFDMASRADGTV